MKKIMFNDRYGLTQAVLDLRKTITRRIAKFSEIDAHYLNDDGWQVDGYVLQCLIAKYAHFKVGEVVAIAQAYRDIWQYSGYMTEIESKQYAGYSNKMFVRAALMPHQICITNVRVERLQDIGDVDCLAEGIEFSHKAQKFYVNRNPTTGACIWLGDTPREAYAALIDRISGKGTWERNPFVFVYEFELVK